MSDWPTVTLHEAGVTLIDCDHKTPKARDEGFPYVGIPQLKDGRITLEGARLISEEDFHHWRRKAKPTPDDVIVSRRCNPGETAYVPEGLEIALGQNLVLLRSDGKKLYPPYLRWIVQGRNWWNQVGKFINVGAVFDSLKCVDIPKFEIKLPPMDAQIKIAEILGSLDKKIELNRQINQSLEQIAQAIFKSWFVDFEPVKAKIAAKKKWLATNEKIECNSPTCYADQFQDNNTPDVDLDEAMTRAAMRAISGKTDEELDQLSPEQRQQLTATAALFPDELEDSELGEIPKGWDVVPVNEHIDILNGFAFKSKDYSEKGTFVLRTKNFNADRIVKRLSDDVFLPDEFLTSHKKYLCKPYDYHLIMVGASVGNRGLIYPHLLPALRNQNMWCFRVKPKSYIKQVFVKYMLDSIVERSMGLASGSAREFFRKGDFGNQNICSGSESIQTEFFNYVLPIMEQQSNLDNEQDILSDIRDSLLPKLLSGEISLGDTQSTAEAVAI